MLDHTDNSFDHFAQQEELGRFQGLWEGGYFEGDPLDPVGSSLYGELGYISSLHAVYQVCLRPFLNSETVALEIGPGRGAWTKAMLEAKEIWCLDAVSAEKNCFWEYIGEHYKSKVNYLQVTDFSCRDLPDDHFDYLFSFGTFCHISWEGQCEYYRNLLPKMKPWGVGMVMFTDQQKYNSAIRRLNQLRVRRVGPDPIMSCLSDAANYLRSFRNGANALNNLKWVEMPESEIWHYGGIERTCNFLESIGWEVLEPDIGLIHRDPIVYFRKKLL